MSTVSPGHKETRAFFNVRTHCFQQKQCISAPMFFLNRRWTRWASSPALTIPRPLVIVIARIKTPTHPILPLSPAPWPATSRIVNRQIVHKQIVLGNLVLWFFLYHVSKYVYVYMCMYQSRGKFILWLVKYFFIIHSFIRILITRSTENSEHGFWWAAVVAFRTTS
jgi:hypothetical protein